MIRNTKGFTLIELLIVVVIIGILAAIAIPKFSATREKAYVSSMKSDLRNLQSAQEIFYSDPANNYAYANDSGNLDDFSYSSGVSETAFDGNTTGWAAAVEHAGTDITCAVRVGDAAAPAGAPAGLPVGVVGCTGDTF